MILNGKGNQFLILFPNNILYPEIIERFTPYVRKLKTPYDSVIDFINASIQSVSFPKLELPLPEQQQKHLVVRHRSAKELETLIDRRITFTFKLGESYLAYWIMFENIKLYLQFYETKSPYWGDFNISFIDNNGFEMLTYSLRQIVPTSISQLDLKYSNILNEFNTFEMSFYYNMFDIIDIEYTNTNITVNNVYEK